MSTWCAHSMPTWMYMYIHYALYDHVHMHPFVHVSLIIWYTLVSYVCYMYTCVSCVPCAFMWVYMYITHVSCVSVRGVFMCPHAHHVLRWYARVSHVYMCVHVLMWTLCVWSVSYVPISVHVCFMALCS